MKSIGKKECENNEEDGKEEKVELLWVDGGVE
jgi:hypothetical protein